MEKLLGSVMKDVIVEYVSGFELWCFKLTCKLCYHGIPFVLIKQCLKRDIYHIIQTCYPNIFQILQTLLKQGAVKISGTIMRMCFTHNWEGSPNLNIYVNKSSSHDICGKNLCICNISNTLVRHVYEVNNISLQHMSELIDMFGAVMDQDLHMNSFDYFCNNIATIRTRNCDNAPEFHSFDVAAYHKNNILMNVIIYDKLFGYDLVIINKNRYTYQGKVCYYYENMKMPKCICYDNDYLDSAKKLGLICAYNSGNIIDVGDIVIFIEYIHDDRFAYHTKLFESHVD